MSVQFIGETTIHPLRFLDRRTIAIARAQLEMVLEKTTDAPLKRDLQTAIEDLIRQDAVQACLSPSDDLTRY